jgi:hypothetical protein
MTTVGYGGITPKTNIGRVLTVLVAFLGTFMISLLIATMSNAIELTDKETEVINQINKEKAAVKVITASMRHYKLRNHRYVDLDESLPYESIRGGTADNTRPTH